MTRDRWWEKAGPSLLFLFAACADPGQRAASEPDAMPAVVDAGLDSGPGIVIPEAGPLKDSSVEDAGDPGLMDAAPAPDASIPDAGQPSSVFCGDAIRDPVTEECDDGPGDASDLCTSMCRVSEAWLVDDTSSARRWGGGPHVLAGSRRHAGAVYVTDVGGAKVWLSRFNGQGAAGRPPLELTKDTQPTAQANPSIAALPSDSFAIAWTDIASASPDIVLTKVTSSGVMTAPVTLHFSASGPQQDVDLVWTGSELVAAWTDTTDIKARRFGADLAPKAGDEMLATTDALESGVVLAAFAGSYAAAFRVGEGAIETIRVVAGDRTWQVSPGFLPAPTGDRPALTSLDEDHLLLVFAEGTEPAGAGQGIVPRLRHAILSVNEPGDVSATPVMLEKEPYASDDTLAQQRPRLATISDTVALLWQQASGSGTGLGSEVLRLVWTWNAAEEALAVAREDQLSVDSAGDQTTPALGTSRLFPGGALLMGFEQATAADDHAAPDLRWTLQPVPWIELDPI